MITYPLNEYKKSDLIAKSRKELPNRYSHRSDSGDDWYLQRIGILELNSGIDDLYLYFKVKGKYRVTLVIMGFKPILDKYLTGKYKNNKKKAISRALFYSLNYCQIKTSCSCPDFKYRFAYMATKKNYATEDTQENRPAKITNPKNKGGLCKHQLRILTLPSKWKPAVISALMNYTKKRGDS